MRFTFIGNEIYIADYRTNGGRSLASDSSLSPGYLFASSNIKDCGFFRGGKCVRLRRTFVTLWRHNIADAGRGCKMHVSALWVYAFIDCKNFALTWISYNQTRLKLPLYQSVRNLNISQVCKRVFEGVFLCLFLGLWVKVIEWDWACLTFFK